MNLYQVSTRKNTIAGTLSNAVPKLFSGSLSKGGSDTFNFTLGKSSSFTMKLGKLSANADAQLLDSSGKVVARSNKPGNRAEKIAKVLEPGSYTVQIRSPKGRTQYSLKMLANEIAATPPVIPSTTFSVLPVDPGNTPETSYDLGTIETNFSVTDKVTSLDPIDFYKFTLSQPGFYIFNIQILDGASAPESFVSGYYFSDLEFTSRDYVVGVTGAQGEISVDATVQLVAGTYFFRVKRDTSLKDVPYKLNITKQP
jgi:hypothetical protein